MRLILRNPVLRALVLLFAFAAAAPAQQLINCAPSTPCTTSGGPSNTNTGDAVWLGGGKINANFIDLYSRLNGYLYVPSSGDTSGATDVANIQAALATLAASVRLPPLISQRVASDVVQLGPGTYWFTTPIGNILRSSTFKTQGVWIKGMGRGVTSFDYNPTVSAPFLTNNHGLDVEMTGITFVGHDVASDFFWSQEQATTTNVQDYTLEDVEFNGSWQYYFRLSGANNNSEWKVNRTSLGAMTAAWYVPPKIATTITNGSNSIAATNNAEQVEVGDTGFFDAAVAPLSANTQYYVVSATGTTFQVATTFGGTPVTFTASGSPNFQTGNDQFLNFWFDQIKLGSGTSLGQWLVLNYGGSIKISNSDVSGHAPGSRACIFNLLGATHARGVQNFQVNGLRIEHLSNNSCTMLSQWSQGSISWNNLDESSQGGLHPIADVMATYQVINAQSPMVEYRNSQLMGVHNYINNSNNYQFQEEALYENITLYDNPSFSDFITITNVGTNSGGYPLIDCTHCRNLLNAGTVGYSEVVDTTLNWQFATSGTLKTRSTPCLGANSDWPSTAGGQFQIRLPLNAAIVSTRFWKAAGSGNSGAFQYTIQTTEATPTVIAGGASTPMAGSNAGTAISLYTTYGANGSVAATSTPFVMDSNLKRTIQVIDSSGTRSGAFTKVYCVIDYIGSTWTPWQTNDDEWLDRLVA